jgi:ubiquinone/menaquinone biosynthesis C-methylase UbiE
MSQPLSGSGGTATNIYHPRFAAFYNWLSNRKAERRFVEPIRRELVGKARGLVLEVGSGPGLNFPFYQPEQVERVEAVEPDSAMHKYAQENLKQAKVPITLTQAPAESLPFPDATFDSVVVTLVFCSVADPAQGFAEIRRVLKPGGLLLIGEHVRAQGTFSAWIQDIMVPVTTRMMGNCHWNRDTLCSLMNAGFQVMEKRDLEGGLSPMIVVQAKRA